MSRKCRPAVPSPHLYREFRSIEIQLYNDFVDKGKSDMVIYDQRYLDLLGWGQALVSCVIESYRQGHRDRLGELWFFALEQITNHKYKTEEIWIEWYWKQ